MPIKFKINLTISMIIAALSLFIMTVLTFEFLHLIPASIERYLTGFSFVSSLPLTIVAAINYFVFGHIDLMKIKSNKYSFNTKLFYILNSLGFLPIIFFVLMIGLLGF